jgi:hypothetical protein
MSCLVLSAKKVIQDRSLNDVIMICAACFPDECNGRKVGITGSSENFFLNLSVICIIPFLKIILLKLIL